MNPTSVPVIPRQPDEATYSTNALALFKTFTRDSYVAAFGVQAAAWDPSRAPKFWFDSTADLSSTANVATYRVIQGSSAALQQLTIPAAEAAAVNLPGAIEYPSYVVAPTGTTRVGAAVNPNYLSTRADAVALMNELGGSALTDDGAAGPYPAVYPATELRRIWTFVVNGNPVNAGVLLAARNAMGVGAPGQWDLSSAFPQWIPAPAAATGLDDTRAPVPVPLRDLLTNEQLQVAPLGLGGVTVVRTDLTISPAGGFTAADRALLQQIYSLLSKTA